jgi:hypothetical protein
VIFDQSSFLDDFDFEEEDESCFPLDEELVWLELRWLEDISVSVSDDSSLGTGF